MWIDPCLACLISWTVFLHESLCVYETALAHSVAHYWAKVSGIRYTYNIFLNLYFVQTVAAFNSSCCPVLSVPWGLIYKHCTQKRVWIWCTPLSFFFFFNFGLFCLYCRVRMVDGYRDERHRWNLKAVQAVCISFANLASLSPYVGSFIDSFQKNDQWQI